jgi:hypothetical protein
MYAQIGDIVLSNKYGFTGFSDKQGLAVVKHPLIDSKPRIDTTGEELIELKFQLTFHRSFVIPEDEKARFVKYMSERIVVPITLGTGEFLGNFLITDIDHQIQQTQGDGSIFESTIDISASEFIGDLSKSTGQANTSNNPPRFQSIVVTKPVAGQIASDYRDVSAMATVINSDLEAANRPETRKEKLKKVLFNIQNVEKKLVNINTISSNVFRLANEASNLREKSNRTLTDLAALKSAVQVSDLESAATANRAFQKNVSNVGGATAPFTKQYIIRRSV